MFFEVKELLKMPILFSAVAHENKILAKYASCDGNFSEIADEVLLKVPNKTEKMTYAHGHYLLHYIAETHNFYFCITDKTCQRSRAFLYLNEIKRRFTPSQGASFCAVLADEMYRYNEDYSTIVIRKGDLDELNSIGVGDSESLLGEKILFVNNPEELSYTVTLTQLKETPNTPLQEVTAKEIFETYTEAVEKAKIETEDIWKTYESKESNKNSENSLESPKYLYYVVITVIFVLIWLALSSLGPVSLVAVAIICILSFTKFSKSKHE